MPIPTIQGLCIPCQSYSHVPFVHNDVILLLFTMCSYIGIRNTCHPTYKAFNLACIHCISSITSAFSTNPLSQPLPHPLSLNDIPARIYIFPRRTYSELTKNLALLLQHDCKNLDLIRKIMNLDHKSLFQPISASQWHFMLSHIL